MDGFWNEKVQLDEDGNWILVKTFVEKSDDKIGTITYASYDIDDYDENEDYYEVYS